MYFGYGDTPRRPEPSLGLFGRSRGVLAACQPAVRRHPTGARTGRSPTSGRPSTRTWRTRRAAWSSTAASRPGRRSCSIPVALSWSRKQPTAARPLLLDDADPCGRKAAHALRLDVEVTRGLRPAAAGGTWSGPDQRPDAGDGPARVLPVGVCAAWREGLHRRAAHADAAFRLECCRDHQPRVVRRRWQASAAAVGEKGTSVLLPLRPPAYAPRVLIAGGDFAPAQKTAEWIDLSLATPAWEALPGSQRGSGAPGQLSAPARTGA